MRNCEIGTNCGASCINRNKLCQVIESIKDAWAKNPITGYKPIKKEGPISADEFIKWLDTSPPNSNKLLGTNSHEGPGQYQDVEDLAGRLRISNREANGIIGAVKEWTDMDTCQEVRDAMRNPNESNERGQELARRIGLFLESATPYEGTIQRGLGFDTKEEMFKVLGEMGAGNPFTDVAHNSWTSNPEVPQVYTREKPFVVTLECRNNRSGASIERLSKWADYGMDEVLVPGGAQYRGLQVIPVNPPNEYRIIVEEI